MRRGAAEARLGRWVLSPAFPRRTREPGTAWFLGPAGSGICVIGDERMVVGCTQEHLKELVEQYKRRPFVDAGPWAGKIGRAMQQHPDGIDEEDLARETGLSPEQIELAVLWQNLEFLRWREQFGQGDDADE